MKNTHQMTMQKVLNDLYDAFAYFNRELFEGDLPDCTISIGVHKSAYALYSPNKFIPKDLEDAIANDAPKLDEIILNPVKFDRNELDILSELVHEMVHQWEKVYGKPAKGAYHNREWAESMKSFGLFPSSTGEPGGKETGRNVHHYIIEGGRFETAAIEYISRTKFSVDWIVPEKLAKKETSRKRTYRCDCPQPWYSNLSGRVATCNECGSEFVEDEV